ncbi:unnamed protein product [Urochloa decumbens]|uniref:Reverse transcriptase zinc-binding domain-containing protein n=1 Tax=Urochloa decumbens TaxID=240449 RepID=A0ABC8Z903_9POAL
MAVVPLPVTTLQQLDRLRKGLFWKGASKCTGGDCQVAWELACRDINDGGVGLKDLATLNTSLLLKHIHKLFAGVQNPWTDWMRLWYDEGYSVEDTPLVAAGGLTAAALQPRLTAAARHELELLGMAIAGVVLGGSHDGRVFVDSPSEAPTAGAFYRRIRTPAIAPPLSDINWVGFAPKKAKIFFWIVRHGRTRTRDSMHRHGALDSPDCPFCPGHSEDLDHLFARCPRLAAFWARVLPGHSPPTSACDAAELVAGLLAAQDAQLGHTAALGALWIVWKSRNRMVFDGIRLDLDALVRLLRDHLLLWCCRASRKLHVSPLQAWCQSLVHIA